MVRVDPRRLKVITFGGAAESVTNLLGGHIDMTAGSVDNMIPHLRSGAVRVLGISGAQRSASLPEVPTLKEQGIDVVQGGWLAVMAPKGLSDAQIAYWDAVFGRSVKTGEWRADQEQNLWESDYLNAAEFSRFLKADYEQARSIFVELGLAKQ